MQASNSLLDLLKTMLTVFKVSDSTSATFFICVCDSTVLDTIDGKRVLKDIKSKFSFKGADL